MTVESPSKPILIITKGAPESYLRAPLEALGHQVEFASLRGPKKIGLICESLLMRAPRGRYAAIVSTEYYRAMSLAFRKWALRDDTPLCVIGFNQSGKVFRTGFGPIDRAINRAAAGIDVALVHSRRERRLWSQIHGIPPERMPFRHWGYDLPEITSTRFSAGGEDYFCLIGRNNRDVEHFTRAIESIGANGVVIGQGDPPGRLSQSSKVRFHVNLPIDDCLDCIRGAVANVILLNDDMRGAGHITAVNAMHLGKPTIFTRCEGLADYLIDGFNGLSVGLRDSESVAAAMQMLLGNRDLRARLGENGRDYARRWLTNDAAARAHAAVISDLARNRPAPPEAPDWLAAYRSLSGRPGGS